MCNRFYHIGNNVNVKFEKRGSNLDNNKYHKKLVIVRLVATSLILLSLTLPHFELMDHSTTPFVILITLFLFYVIENKYEEKRKWISLYRIFLLKIVHLWMLKIFWGIKFIFPLYFIWTKYKIILQRASKKWLFSIKRKTTILSSVWRFQHISESNWALNFQLQE